MLMKSNYTTTILFTFLSLLAYSQTEKKVLFIGNSYTGVNNLPLMVKNMTESAGDVLIYDANTPGGYTFEGHSTNATTIQKISAEDWDYVVLQEQSQKPAFPQPYVEENVIPYAESLCTMIRANNECSEPMFYMTWGRQNGDQSNCEYMSWMCSYEGMDDALNASYTNLAEINHAELAPAGAVWRYLRENHPEINLYSGDGSHPSVAGSYAAGCAFYSTIFKKDPTLITWNSSLSESVATTIKNAAQTIVYNALDSWDFSINPAIANFTEVIDNNLVLFTNTSENTDSLIWDFGDGNTANEAIEVHNYSLAGTYSVSLINFRCGQTDTLTKSVIISTSVNVNNADAKSVIRIFPNPTSDFVEVDLDKDYKKVAFTLTDINGRILISETGLKSGAKIHLSYLSNRMYFLNVSVDENTSTYKILKVR